MKRLVYIKESGAAAVLWSILFTASVLVGDADLQVGQAWPSTIPGLTGPPLIVAGKIFINNISVAGLLAVGAVTGGLLSAAVLALNAVILGVVVSRALVVGLAPITVTVLVFPHASELVGFWLAAGVGFRGFCLAIKYIKCLDFQVAAELPRVYRTLVAAALLVGMGALMESYVSIPLALRLTQ